MGKTKALKRPKYENEASEHHERLLMQAFRQYTQRTQLFGYKLPMAYGVDFMLLDREVDNHKWEHCNVRAFAECKARSYASTDFTTYMISLAKWNAMLDLRDRTRKEVFLIIGFTDAAYYLAIDEHVTVRLAAGGRGDRGDLQDFEPCVYISLNFFTKLANRAKKKTTKGMTYEYTAI